MRQPDRSISTRPAGNTHRPGQSAQNPRPVTDIVYSQMITPLPTPQKGLAKSPQNSTRNQRKEKEDSKFAWFPPEDTFRILMTVHKDDICPVLKFLFVSYSESVRVPSADTRGCLNEYQFGEAMEGIGALCSLDYELARSLTYNLVRAEECSYGSKKNRVTANTDPLSR